MSSYSCSVNMNLLLNNEETIIYSNILLLAGKNWNQVGFKPTSLAFRASALTSRPPSPLFPSALVTQRLLALTTIWQPYCIEETPICAIHFL